MSDKPTDHRKVYARGYFDGLKAAGVDDTNEHQIEGDKMNKAKLDSIMNNATAISKKVYDAVPINECWSVVAIHNEAVRLGISNPDKRIIEGCLHSLKGQGVIKEPKAGYFTRSNVHIPQKNERKKSVEPTPITKGLILDQPVEGETPIEILSRLAEMARKISGAANSFATAIENAAISIDDAIKSKDKEHEKLHQLKNLLKNLD